MIQPTQDVNRRLSAIRGLELPPPDKRKSLAIQHLKPGGYLDLDGETYQVLDVFRYLEVKWNNFGKPKKQYWVTELQLMHLLSGTTRFIEWEVDDKLELSQTLSEVALRDIHCEGRPLTRAVLEAIAEEEYGVVECQGKSFRYSDDDSWAALFYRNAEDEPLPVRLYEFSSDDGSYLTIELWQEEGSKPAREAFVSRELDGRQVVVLQADALGAGSSEVGNARS